MSFILLPALISIGIYLTIKKRNLAWSLICVCLILTLPIFIVPFIGYAFPFNLLRYFTPIILIILGIFLIKQNNISIGGRASFLRMAGVIYIILGLFSLSLPFILPYLTK
jgi:hypothetical protein